MPRDITLTTGQTSGLTGLDKQTIQRYVRRYPVGFSDQARQPVKGRRFNGQDIKNLLLINHMLNTKQKANIEKALSGEYESPDFMLFDIVNFMQMYQTFDTLQKTFSDLAEKIESENKKFISLASYYRRLIDNHADVLSALRWDVAQLKMIRATKDQRPEPEHLVKARERGAKSIIQRFKDVFNDDE